jgi:hypothetical protein
MALQSSQALGDCARKECLLGLVDITTLQKDQTLILVRGCFVDSIPS